MFILAGLSAAAPPVNIWAMILCAGTAIPYVGFEFTLGIPVLLLGTFTVLVLGLEKRRRRWTCRRRSGNMPEVPQGMTWWRVLLPFLVFFGADRRLEDLALCHAHLRPASAIRHRGRCGASRQPSKDQDLGRCPAKR